MLDYAGNAGISNKDAAGFWGVGWDGITAVGNIKQTRLADITDGTSNTIMVGEKRMYLSQCSGNCQPDDNDGYVGGFQDDVVRWGVWPPDRDMRQGCTTPTASQQFGSSHAGGAMFVFCDGSVKMISFSVTDTVMQRASSIDDGEVFSLD
jgi:prepilin-type processing-associated H-X9-DG protein